MLGNKVFNWINILCLFRFNLHQKNEFLTKYAQPNVDENTSFPTYVEKYNTQKPSAHNWLLFTKYRFIVRSFSAKQRYILLYSQFVWTIAGNDLEEQHLNCYAIAAYDEIRKRIVAEGFPAIGLMRCKFCG